VSARRPFRFGLFVGRRSESLAGAAAWRDAATRAEALGYSTLFMADHFVGPGAAAERAAHPPQVLAPVPALAVAAAATTTLRVGTRVLCVDYRRPVVLAKEAATLDLLSDGRLELGLGAGWMESEYEAAGIPFDPVAVRIDRLGEVVRLVKAFMSDGEVSVEGRHVRLVGMTGAPKPVQRPHPPLMIGGGGRAILGLAGREADIVSINFDNRSGRFGHDMARRSTAEMTDHKLDWVRKAAGPRFPEIELEVGAYFTAVTARPGEAIEAIGRATGLDEDQIASFPHALVGSVDEIVEKLEERRERWGISYVSVGDNVVEEFAPVVERLAGH
jgi:probable F420-dependent oxidoreductase